jgi:hypothetical protein
MIKHICKDIKDMTCDVFGTIVPRINSTCTVADNAVLISSSENRADRKTILIWLLAHKYI